MSLPKSQFELTRVFDDGSQESPEIIPVTAMPWDTRMERRGFLGVGMSAGVAMLLLDSPGHTAERKKAQTQQKGQGKTSPPVKAHMKGVRALAITSDGKMLASGSGDKTIKLWTLPEGRLLTTLTGHADSVRALTITPDGKMLASGHGKGFLIIWDLGRRSFRSFLFDPAANTPDTKGLTYNVYDRITGQTMTYTLPCGSPIPPGATCMCNCVPGTAPAPSRVESGGGTYTYCTCNKICTCVPVRY